MASKTQMPVIKAKELYTEESGGKWFNVVETLKNLVDAVPTPVQKTSDMTQPVGVDTDGRLWTATGNIDDLKTQLEDNISNTNFASDAFANDFEIFKTSSSGKIINIVLDNETSQTKYVPDNVVELASIKAIGGKTVKESDIISGSPVLSIISSYDGTTVEELAIPESIIKLCSDYGEGLTEYNILDFENKRYIKKVKKIALSDLSWQMHSQANRIYIASTPDRKNSSDFLCDKYTVTTNNANMPDKSIFGSSNYFGTRALAIRDTDYSTLADFKDSLTGLYICYPLEIETTTEIPGLTMPVISAKPDGTITFVNDNGSNVYSSVEFYEKLSPTSISGYSIVTLDGYEGDTLEDKLYNALDDTSLQSGIILCGEISITRTYVANANKDYGNITILGAKFVFNTQNLTNGVWFDQSAAQLNKVPTFSNCYFSGSGVTLFSGNCNLVKAKFTDCSLHNLSIISGNVPEIVSLSPLYAQSLYLINCSVYDVNNIVKIEQILDFKMIGCMVEASRPIGEDTFIECRHANQMSITDSLVEQRRNVVIKIINAYGVSINSCYFENLFGGVLTQNGANAECGVSIENNAFYGNYNNQNLNHMITINSNKYDTSDGYLSVSRNFDGMTNYVGDMCNISKYYIVSTDNTKQEIIFDENGFAKLRT